MPGAVTKKDLRRLQQALVVAAVVGSVAVLAGGSMLYRSQERELRGQAEEQLRTISRLKVDQIVRWREDGVADGRRAMDDPGLATLLQRWKEAPDDASEELLRGALRSNLRSGGYRSALLVSKSGDVLVVEGEPVEALHPSVREVIGEAVAADRSTLSDLHYSEGDESPHIDVVAPLSPAGSGASEAVALVLHSDARDFLFPLVQLWPTPSRTAETLLVRRDGDRALFLNDLRHAANPDMSLTVPMSESEVPAVRALEGQRGVYEGPDYRGARVLSYLTEVPGSPWIMVAKIDVDEAFAAWRSGSRFVIGLIVSLAMLVAGALLLTWQTVRAVRLEGAVQAERARRAAEERLAVTLTSVGDAVISTDERCLVEFMNPVAEVLTGWSLSEAKGRPLGDVFVIANEYTGEPVESPAECVLRDNVVVGLANHTVLHSKDGVVRAIADSGAPIHDDEGAVTGVVLVFRDQTDEREAAWAVAQSEALFRTLIEQTDQGVTVGRPDGTILVYNDAMARISGYSREEVESGGWLDLAFPTPERKAEALRQAQVALEGGLPYTEVAIVRKDGEERWLWVATSPVRIDTDLYSLSIYTDVTEHKAAERDLEASETRFREVVEGAPDAIFVQVDHRFVYVNPAACRLYGATSSEELLGRPILDVVDPALHSRVTERIVALNERRMSQGPIDQTHIRLDGSRVDVEVSAVPMAYDGHDGALVFVRDVTDRKEVEKELARHRDHLEEMVLERTRELERANAELERATRAKSNFLASMSHELRTPLNSIIGFSGLLSEGMSGQLTDEQYTQVRMINTAGKHLLALINDVLDISKIEAGRVELSVGDFDPLAVVGEVVSMLAPLAAEKSIELSFHAPGEPERMHSDAGKVKQILLNLVGNAVKFTEVGSVGIRLAQEGEQMAFVVSDTGPGISSEDASRVFERFTQLETPVGEVKPGGTGLGLSISQEYARLLGGEIAVDTTATSGAVFILRVPRSV